MKFEPRYLGCYGVLQLSPRTRKCTPGQVGLQDGPEGVEEGFGYLLVAGRGKMDEVRELGVLAVEVRLGVHKGHFRMLGGKLPHQVGMDAIGLDLPP